MSNEQRTYLLLDPKEDCLELKHPHSVDEIAANLRIRYACQRNKSSGLRYTRIGSDICLAINSKTSQPQPSVHIVGNAKEAQSYSDQNDPSLKGTTQEPFSLQDFAQSVYTRMYYLKQDQSVFISGETGSGKSSNHKQTIYHLCRATLTPLSPTMAKLEAATLQRGDKLTVKIESAETILEAFGHAWCRNSPNASRYSRYTELQYDTKGKLIGYKVLDYLLEKGRVAGNFTLGEANFHIFYYLLAGASTEEKFDWALDAASSFNYLGFPPNGKSYASPFTNMVENEKMDAIRQAFFSLGLYPRKQHEIYHCVAAILHLGNIQFDQALEPNDPCQVKNRDHLAFTASLLGVSAEDLELALTYRTQLFGKELCTVYLNAEEAAAQRDALAITLYSLLFSWIVEYINQQVCQEDCSTFIGLLDFFGMDSSRPRVKFEGLLNNYANEKIHNKIIRRIVQEKHDQMKKDGVLNIKKMSMAGCASNSSHIEFLGSPGIGFLAAIDRESMAYLNEKGHGNETAGAIGYRLLSNLSKEFPNHPLFQVSPMSFTGPADAHVPVFALKHFTGGIEYDASEILDTNLDILYPDFVTLFRKTNKKKKSLATNVVQIEFIRDLFGDKLVQTKKHWQDQSVLVEAATAKAPKRKPSVRKKRKTAVPTSTETPEEDAIAITTLSSSFVSALDDLLKTLDNTHSWFIFCISPNQEEELIYASKFEEGLVKRQLLEFGVPVMAGARSACKDYSLALSPTEFINKYALVVNMSRIDLMGNPVTPDTLDLEKCLEYFRNIGWKSGDYDMGADSGLIYLTEKSFEYLNEAQSSLKEQMKREELEAKSRQNLSWRTPQQSDIQDMQESDNDSYAPSFVESIAEKPCSDIAKLPAKEEIDKGPVLYRHSTMDIEKGMKMKPFDRTMTLETQVVNSAPVSSQRKRWLCCTWCLTWWIPTYCLTCCRMTRKDVRVAWREKVALCIMIFFMCASLLFFIIFLGPILCPRQNVYSIFELEGKKDLSEPWAYGYGHVYDIKHVIRKHRRSYNVDNFKFGDILGKDISLYFNKVREWDRLCKGIPSPEPDRWNNTDMNVPSFRPNFYYHDISEGYFSYLNHYSVARVAWDWDYFVKQDRSKKRYVVIYDNVYDITTYDSLSNDPFGPAYRDLFDVASATDGIDASSGFNKIVKQYGTKNTTAVLKCMNEMFYVGVIDTRNTFVCRLSNYILLASSALIALVILFKFVAALQFGARRSPEENDKFVICMVPCYTEGVESLTKTLESLAVMSYDDKRKLLFVICDGMIIGSGNERPTPRIVLDILGVDMNKDPEALSFYSLGEGDKQHNMGKVYSGLYEIQGHNVPFVVIVKVGKPSEHQRPGNRGKRDSQLLLMRFLSRVHFNNEMNPLELEMYHQMKNIIGVNPSFYEYVLMVDADTETRENALNVMISTMAHDSKIVGLCGETLLSNEKETWISMIQVYEYFISHHLSKAFESLFGSVTCLPGCFCMYRIRSSANNRPLLIAPAVLNDYSINEVDTLHLKNLLHLGEDRYLTTLMMKHFPNMKLSYTSEAKCETHVPNQWGVLLSQRRRWINSTVHNLFELVFLPQLCGFCCLSMRFVVFLDLFSTLVQPASVVYIGYLIYSLFSSDQVFPLISLCMLAGVYGLQVIIFIVKKQWGQIAWMLMYILALPVFSFYIPIYSFWHMDDFSWGNTRVVVGDDGKKTTLVSNSKPFDPASIPLKKWSEFETEMMEKLSKNSAPSQPEEAMSSYTLQSPYPAYAPSAYSRVSVPYSAMPSPALGYHVQHRSSPMHRLSLSSMGSSFHCPSVMTDITAPSQSKPDPPDSVLLTELDRLLRSCDLMSTTKKQIRQELSHIFGVKLSHKRALINNHIDAFLKTLESNRH